MLAAAPRCIRVGNRRRIGCRPKAGHRGRWPTGNRSWSCRGRDRARGSASRRRRAWSSFQDRDQSVVDRPQLERREADPMAPAWNDRCRSLRLPSSATDGTGAGARRIWRRRHRRRAPRSAGRLRSAVRGPSLDDARPSALVRSQLRQAYFGRRVTITRYLAGILSRRSERSSPITWRSFPQQGHVLLAGSMTISSRGRWDGRWPRLTLRAFLRDALSVASAFSTAASPEAIAVSRSSRPRLS